MILVVTMNCLNIVYPNWVILYELFICNWISCFKNKINFTNWVLYIQFFQWYRVDNAEMCSLLSSVSNTCDHFGLNAGAGITQVSLDFHCRKVNSVWPIFICIWSAIYLVLKALPVGNTWCKAVGLWLFFSYPGVLGLVFSV